MGGLAVRRVWRADNGCWLARQVAEGEGECVGVGVGLFSCLKRRAQLVVVCCRGLPGQ